uniref:Myosin motor domain-containing protein n=1 Tax=Chromera velia CCMP2878 TaxID=1169474 RepID=A0A0G4FJ49_9ALVE|eukprot:Cvel_17296.t1-p1 / transcript=Cvel_17296.t1 / gene=Cvel_17296 / organism=Chromera_velia_CCMP2878 / gene_product=Myosin-13, putative / transcript_product=Myosin-13, putative / location=Cvel_scaffold1373:5518-16796(+) / protein_length=1838 / sequence_SO=supercontig / SO=protein_coding / is_pseudo=false
MEGVRECREILEGDTVWVPDESEGFLQGTVTQKLQRPHQGRDVTGSQETLQVEIGSSETSSGTVNPPKVLEVPSASVFRVHSQPPADDNASLVSLDPASILQNLRDRFKQDQIYTYTAHVLLAVNPYCDIANLYGEDRMHAYTGRPLGALPPHPYAIADAAYRSMQFDKHPQAVVVSGESGAGKTETAKIIMTFLAKVGSGEAQMASKGGGRGAVGGGKKAPPRRGEKETRTMAVRDLQARVLGATPILESFGNARTVRNVNSSRFGKMNQLFFSDSGGLVGCGTTTYLLERSRTVLQGRGERNYHVFYQMLRGLSRADLERLYLDADPSVYRLLNQGEEGGALFSSSSSSGSDEEEREREETEKKRDLREFGNMRAAMSANGMDAAEQMRIFSVIAGLIHLGEVVPPSEQDEREKEGDRTAGEEGGDTTPTAAGAEGDDLNDRDDSNAPTPPATGDGEASGRTVDFSMPAGGGASFSPPLGPRLSPPTCPSEPGDEDTGDDDGRVRSSFGAEEQLSLHQAAELLGFDELDLERTISTRQVAVKGRRSLCVLPLSVRQKTGVIQTLIKTVYARLFERIVTQINKQTEVHSRNEKEKEKEKEETDSNLKDRFVGILDIYGFECMPVNSFEQLCINVANERLQHFFVEKVLQSEQQLYLRQGLKWTPLELPDSTPVIDAVSKVFKCLDDCSIIKLTQAAGTAAGAAMSHSRFADRVVADAKWTLPQWPRGLPHPIAKAKRAKETGGEAAGVPQGYASVIFSVQGRAPTPPPAGLLGLSTKNPYEMKRHGGANRSSARFAVRHFAADVVYSTQGWLEKNNDRVAPELERLIAGSTDQVVHSLARIEGGGALQSGGFRSVSKHFLTGLREMVKELSRANLHFIRCMLPNDRQAPLRFDGGRVLDQMRQSGTLVLVELMHRGFPSRVPCKDLADRYRAAIPALAGWDDRSIVSCLMRLYELPPKSWVMGATHVFLKSGLWAQLDEMVGKSPQPGEETIKKMKRQATRERVRVVVRVADIVGWLPRFCRLLKARRAFLAAVRSVVLLVRLRRRYGLQRWVARARGRVAGIRRLCLFEGARPLRDMKIGVERLFVHMEAVRKEEEERRRREEAERKKREEKERLEREKAEEARKEAEAEARQRQKGARLREKIEEEGSPRKRSFVKKTSGGRFSFSGGEAEEEGVEEEEGKEGVEVPASEVFGVKFADGRTGAVVFDGLRVVCCVVKEEGGKGGQETAEGSPKDMDSEALRFSSGGGDGKTETGSLRSICQMWDSNEFASVDSKGTIRRFSLSVETPPSHDDGTFPSLPFPALKETRPWTALSYLPREWCPSTSASSQLLFPLRICYLKGGALPRLAVLFRISPGVRLPAVPPFGVGMVGGADEGETGECRAMNRDGENGFIVIVQKHNSNNRGADKGREGRVVAACCFDFPETLAAVSAFEFGDQEKETEEEDGEGEAEARVWSEYWMRALESGKGVVVGGPGMLSVFQEVRCELPLFLAGQGGTSPLYDLVPLWEGHREAPQDVRPAWFSACACASFSVPVPVPGHSKPSGGGPAGLLWGSCVVDEVVVADGRGQVSVLHFSVEADVEKDCGAAKGGPSSGVDFFFKKESPESEFLMGMGSRLFDHQRGGKEGRRRQRIQRSRVQMMEGASAAINFLLQEKPVTALLVSNPTSASSLGPRAPLAALPVDEPLSGGKQQGTHHHSLRILSRQNCMLKVDVKGGCAASGGGNRGGSSHSLSLKQFAPHFAWTLKGGGGKGKCANGTGRSISLAACVENVPGGFETTAAAIVPPSQQHDGKGKGGEDVVAVWSDRARALVLYSEREGAAGVEEGGRVVAAVQLLCE